MHYLAVHTELLGTAPASWNFFSISPGAEEPPGP